MRERRGDICGKHGLEQASAKESLATDESLPPQYHYFQLANSDFMTALRRPLSYYHESPASLNDLLQVQQQVCSSHSSRK